jgi:hypothetical protein
MLQVNPLVEYINNHQIDGIMWKAKKLLGDLPHTDMRRHDHVMILANTLTLIPHQVLRDDYVRKISKEYDINCKALEKLIIEALHIAKKKDEIKRIVRKNCTAKLSVDPTTFPFFTEQFKKGEETFSGIKIDKVKFIELLSHFGFTRYEPSSSLQDGKFIFVRMQDNVVKAIPKNGIIDFLEDFIRTNYRFDDAGYTHANADILLNHFYERINYSFSTDLFARVRSRDKIIINEDKKDATYLYYQNGFVEITKEDYKLRAYDEMEGSIWEHQMLNRNFQSMELEIDLDGGILIGSSPDENGKAKNIMKAGYFADFCFKISNSDLDRFKSLCSIIGYLIHNYYQYSLQAILFTDSSLNDGSNGRTGKTLLAKMIGMVRSLCEINGKDFDSNALSKYQDAELGTQVIHINDIKHSGKFKFEFENVFNDITEGYIIKKLYMHPFRQQSKMIISTNKTLNIQGDSQRARIVEYEFSDFFNANNRPDKYYAQWFGRDWDENEFKKFDNFMCLCSQVFHRSGILEATSINLQERKLIDHTSPEFLQFMDDVKDNLGTAGVPWKGYEEKSQLRIKATYEMREFEFDRKRLYERFISENPEMKWCTPRKFYSWINQFSKARYEMERPNERKSNGGYFIKFS